MGASCSACPPPPILGSVPSPLHTNLPQEPAITTIEAQTNPVTVHSWHMAILHVPLQLLWVVSLNLRHHRPNLSRRTENPAGPQHGGRGVTVTAQSGVHYSHHQVRNTYNY